MLALPTSIVTGLDENPPNSADTVYVPLSTVRVYTRYPEPSTVGSPTFRSIPSSDVTVRVPSGCQSSLRITSSVPHVNPRSMVRTTLNTGSLRPALPVPFTVNVHT